MSIKRPCDRCGVDEAGKFWPTCADVVYKHPHLNWVDLHEVICNSLWGHDKDDLEVCDNCEAQMKAEEEAGA